MAEPWLKKTELASVLKLSPRTIERKIKPTLKAGNQNRYLLSDAVAQLRGVPEEGGNVIRFPRERTRGEAA
ncbi:MAG TPA: hypothetical protein VFX35_00415 [Solirubrobacterales bacterium]|nr:hypothetical protein [Solirubrobacterales bacterium]